MTRAHITDLLSFPTQQSLCLSLSLRQTSVDNRRARCKGCVLALLGFSVPFMLMAALVLGSLSRELLEMSLGHDGIEALSLYLVSVFVRERLCLRGGGC